MTEPNKDPSWLESLLSESSKDPSKPATAEPECDKVHETCGLAALMAIIVAIWDDEMSDNPMSNRDGLLPTRTEFATLMTAVVEAARPLLSRRKSRDMTVPEVVDFLRTFNK